MTTIAFIIVVEVFGRQQSRDLSHLLWDLSDFLSISGTCILEGRIYHTPKFQLMQGVKFEYTKSCIAQTGLCLFCEGGKHGFEGSRQGSNRVS